MRETGLAVTGINIICISQTHNRRRVNAARISFFMLCGINSKMLLFCLSIKSKTNKLTFFMSACYRIIRLIIITRGVQLILQQNRTNKKIVLPAFLLQQMFDMRPLTIVDHPTRLRPGLLSLYDDVLVQLCPLLPQSILRPLRVIIFRARSLRLRIPQIQ